MILAFRVVGSGLLQQGMHVETIKIMLLVVLLQLLGGVLARQRLRRVSMLLSRIFRSCTGISDGPYTVTVMLPELPFASAPPLKILWFPLLLKLHWHLRLCVIVRAPELMVVGVGPLCPKKFDLHVNLG